MYTKRNTLLDDYFSKWKSDPIVNANLQEINKKLREPYQSRGKLMRKQTKIAKNFVIHLKFG